MHMKEIAGYQVIDTLYQGRRSEIYRAIKNGESFIIKIPNSPYAEKKLIHEFNVGQKISSEYVIKFLELQSDSRYGHVLIEEDDRAQTLQTTIPAQGFPLLLFLKIATQLAEGLQHIHESNIIHKDIKPANIIIKMDTNKIKYIDFNSALTQRNNQQALISKGIATTEATLAYISPELTGRINQRVDYRTDFYSLGVTFYHLLCGVLPFRVKSVAELVHSHLAKQPLAPNQVNTSIPKVVSSIVMKLMDKNPELRYQSAVGLLVDLKRCLDELTQKGDITPFVLAEEDIPEYFCFPVKLYGRDSELATLAAACDRVARSQTEIVMVAGEGGSGKSVLVQEMQPVIASKGGYFMMGKYEALKANIPYNGIVQALKSWLEQILACSNEEIGLWKTVLLNQLGNQGQLMTDLLPDLELIIGEQSPLPTLAGDQAKIRCHFVFQRFMSALTNSAPILLFLDDLQWADPASLELLEALISNNGIHHLLVVGTYRKLDVSQAQLFSRFVNKVQEYQISITTIELPPLSQSAINQWTADVVRTTLQEAASLSTVIEQKTAGCPFFVKVFMQSIYDQGLLTQVRGHWQWNLDKIRSMPVTENLISFLVLQMQQLSSEIQSLLQFISCLGHKFTFQKLMRIQERSPEHLSHQLNVLVEKGLLVESDDEYSFAHDRIQEAVLQQIPPEKIQLTHLEIGTSLKATSQNLEEAVDHLNRAITKINEEAERLELAKLNLMVAEKAKHDVAYASALNYLKTAQCCIQSVRDIWKDDHHFAVQLHKELAEVEHLTTNYEASEEILELTLHHVTDVLEKADIYNMMLVHLHTRGLLSKSIDVGIEALKLLGVDIDTTRLESVCQEEWMQLKEKLSKIETHTLLNAPKATNPHALMCMKLVESIQASAYSCNSLLHDVLVAKFMGLTLRYGNSSESAVAFVTCGMVLISKFGEISHGHALGQLALKLSEQSGNAHNICRCFMLYSAFVHHWRLPVEESESYFNHAEKAGEEAGDYQYIGYALVFKALHHFYASVPLEDQQKQLLKILEKPWCGCSRVAIASVQAMELIIANLRGESPSVRVFPEIPSDDKYLAKWKDEKLASVCWYLILKAQILYCFGEMEAALGVLIEAEPFLEYVLGILAVPSYFMYLALTMLALYPTASQETKKNYLEKIDYSQGKLKTWAENCPENFMQKLLMVQAERIYVVDGDLWSCLEKLEQAQQAAEKCGSIIDQALVNELTADFFMSQNKPHCARGFLQTAFQLYERWGAKHKLDLLRAKFGNILNSSTGKLSSYSTSADETISANSLRMLDLTTILKTSQAISSEVDLRKLLSKILNILITTAGAQKASFFMEEKGNLFVQAECSTEGNVELLQHLPVVHWERGSRSVVDFVRRTLQPLLLGNASTDRRFSQDAYITVHQIQSVLCSPIVRHGELKAVLYLENNLSSNVFSEQHMQILVLLGAQIAISLENSTCYDSITSLNEQLNLALQSGNVGTWCWYFHQDIVVWDERMYRLFDVDTNDLETTKAGWLRLIHPDDLALVEDTSRAAQEGIPFAIEYRIIKKGGNICTLESVGRTVSDENGKPYLVVGVVRDITRRKLLEQERLQALSVAEEKERRRAEEAEKYRTNLENFINQICHEIRNPMSGIFGNVDISQGILRSMKHIIDVVAQNPHYRSLIDYWVTLGESIDQIHQCVKHQKAIVDDVLDLSKLESTQSAIEAVSFSLKSAVREVAQMFAAPLALKKVNGILSLPDSDPWVTGDCRRLKIALTNIVCNAVKYTEQGTVKISLELLEMTDTLTSFRISVEDTGIGMTVDEQSLLFQRFARVAAAQFEGSGLGLYLSKRFVECMGGRIEVVSQKGQGSKFSIFLQLKSALPPKNTPIAVALPGTQKTMKVLVVEDNVVNQRILKRQLEQAGHQCEVAGNGLEAVNQWKTSKFDLIFMDIEMPVMGGFEATQTIRKYEKDKDINPAVYIVGLSAFSSPQFVKQAQEVGMDDYITKPYEKSRIYEAIVKCETKSRKRNSLGFIECHQNKCPRPE